MHNFEELSNNNFSTKTVRVVIAVIIVIVLALIVNGLNGGEDSSNHSSNRQNATNQNVRDSTLAEPNPKTEQEIMFDKLIELVKDGDAFDTGSYVKGEIPAGEYAFVRFDGSGQYYSEEDGVGNIIDNENFDSFGYVYVHGAGNLQTDGALVKIGAFEKLGVNSAKEIYEKLNNVSNYYEGAMYKVNTDITSGTYVMESYGEGYVEVMSGPVGKSSIVDNEIFNGKYSVNLDAGQYLKVSGAKLLK